MKTTAMLVVLAALGCGTATNNTGGGSDGGPTGDRAEATGSPGSVACVSTTCSGAGRNICCVDLAFTPPFLSGTCTGDVATCTQVALACDDVTDCPSAQRCCAYQLGINGMQRTFSTCKPACGGLTAEREICDRRGAGRCASGAFCCRQPSDLLGVCVASEALCVPDAGSP